MRQVLSMINPFLWQKEEFADNFLFTDKQSIFEYKFNYLPNERPVGNRVKSFDSNTKQSRKSECTLSGYF